MQHAQAVQVCISSSRLLLLCTQVSAKHYVSCTTPDKGCVEYSFVSNSLQVAMEMAFLISQLLGPVSDPAFL